MNQTIILFLYLLVISSLAIAQDYKEVIKLQSSDINSDDFFGRAVCISGNYAIASSLHDCEDALGENPMSQAGSAYIFERNTDNQWIEVQKIVASDRYLEDDFGNSAEIFGNLAIVGAKFNSYDASGENYLYSSGSAYIFKRDEVGVWHEIQKVVASDRTILDRFGNSVSISNRHAFISAFTKNYSFYKKSVIQYAGALYVFECDSNGYWNEVQKIVAPDKAEHDYFGYSADISGNYILVGATGEDEDAAGVRWPDITLMLHYNAKTNHII